jgi:hypothetical protein
MLQIDVDYTFTFRYKDTMTNAMKLTAAQQKIMDRFQVKPSVHFSPSNGAETLAAKALVRKGLIKYDPISAGFGLPAHPAYTLVSKK